MDSKLALVNCITLMYNESILASQTTSENIIKAVTDSIKTPDSISDGDIELQILLKLKHTITGLLNDPETMERSTLIQDIRVSCAFDPSVFAAIKESLMAEMSIEERSKANLALRATLKRYVNQLKLKNTISGLSFELNRGSSRHLDDIVGDMRKSLANYTDNGATGGEVTSFMKRVSTGDAEGFKRIFDNTKEQLSGNVLKCGWQDINAMCGINGGFVPGELWCIPALPHHCKTLYSLLLFISFGLFNDAKDFERDGKPPLLYDISLENDLEVNLPIIYMMVKEWETGIKVNIKDINSSEASDYITAVLARRGWTFIFERHNSSQFTVEIFNELITGYETDYTIVGCRVDYLGVSNKRGLGNGTIGSEVREMYRWARNIANPKKILVISPHQLSPEAKRMRNMDETNFVRDLPGKGLYDGCTTVDNELDGEMYIGKTIIGGRSFLECQRGKHRTLTDTPERLRYTVIPFAEVGTLPWDVGGPKRSAISIAAIMGNDPDAAFSL